MSAAPLDLVPVGASPVRINRFVLGCANIGGLYATVGDEEAAATLEAAWRGGVRSFDTAPHYGVGLSEERLGRFLADRPADEVVLSTKVGRVLVDTDEDVEGVDSFYGTPRRRRERDYSRDGVRRSLEDSLRRLGRERVELALVHDPEGYEQLALDEAVPALHELRDEGLVGAVGVGTTVADVAARFVERAELDCVLIAGCCSLLGAPAAETLFPACRARGVTVLAAGVYQSGILANPRPGAHLDYRLADQDALSRVAQIQTVCERYGVALPAAAVQFVLRYDDVAVVVIGAASASRVEQNLAYASTEVPDELFTELADRGLSPRLPRLREGVAW